MLQVIEVINGKWKVIVIDLEPKHHRRPEFTTIVVVIRIFISTNHDPIRASSHYYYRRVKESARCVLSISVTECGGNRWSVIVEIDGLL